MSFEGWKEGESVTDRDAQHIKIIGGDDGLTALWDGISFSKRTKHRASKSIICKTGNPAKTISRREEIIKAENCTKRPCSRRYSES